jgi:hypothetical protein
VANPCQRPLCAAQNRTLPKSSLSDQKVVADNECPWYLLCRRFKDLGHFRRELEHCPWSSRFPGGLPMRHTSVKNAPVPLSTKVTALEHDSAQEFTLHCSRSCGTYIRQPVALGCSGGSEVTGQERCNHHD